MKKFLFVLLCVAIPLVSIAQPSSVRKVSPEMLSSLGKEMNVDVLKSVTQ